MADGLKSSFELAMERLRAKEKGGAADLTPEQKERIARIRADYKARRAELEFLHRSAIEKAEAREDQEKLKQLADEYGRESADLDAREEADVRAARGD